ncbi:MAG: hypothetical protein ACE5EO_07425 [Candidatus Krumholzibacteriia bacterium]
MHWTRSWLAAACLIAFAAADGRAGTVIVVDTETFTRPTSEGTATVYLEKNRLRIDSTEGGTDYTVIYDRGTENKPRYWLIDRRASTYVEVTWRDMQRIRAQAERSRKAIDRQIQNLTPERKRQMERLYRRPVDELAKDPARPEYRKVSTGTRVSHWTCDQYEGYQGGEKREDVWAAAWGALGITRADLVVFGDMADMFEGAGQRLPAFFSFAREDAAGVEGFPIMVVAYEGESPSERSKVRELRREPIDPQLFKLPEGLTRRNISQ